MTTKVRALMATMAAMAVAGSTLVLTGAPAAAAPEGSGKALIRVDAARAKITKTENGAMVLTLPTDSAGQWLGERTAANGKSRLRVGTVTSAQLSEKWGTFKYGSTRPLATLTWNTKKGTNGDGASVRVGRPYKTSNGIAFPTSSKSEILSSLKNITLNLLRAGDGQQVRTDYNGTNDVDMTKDMHFWAGLTYGNGVDTRLYNHGNNNTCWRGTIATYYPATTLTLPDGRCDDVAYTGSSTVWKPESNHSVVRVNFNLTPDGQSSFNHNNTILEVYGIDAYPPS